MHLTDAASTFHSYLLSTHPNGLNERFLPEFYSRYPEAADRIKKRRLYKFLKEYSHLFSTAPSGEEGQDSNKLVIKAKSQATAKKVQQLNQKQMQALALMFYDECLKGRSVVLKRCEDRNLFTQELYSWKEVQRRKNVNLKGASPSGIMNTLCKLKKVERAHDNTVLVWKELSNSNDATSNNHRTRARARTRNERVQEAIDRVRFARTQLEQNRNGIVVDHITFHIDQDDVARPKTELIQDVRITNNAVGNVHVQIKDEIAKRRAGVVVESDCDGEDKNGFVVEGNGGMRVVRVRYTPKTIGFLNTIISFDFRFLKASAAEAVFAIVRYITVRCGDPDDHAILKPTSQYERKRNMGPHAFQKPVRVEKNQMSPNRQKNFAVALKPYRIPPHVQDAIRTKSVEDLLTSILYDGTTPPDELPSDLTSVLSLRNYTNFFQTLLWIEEAQMSIDIRNYDMKNVGLERRGRFYSLLIPGLAESRPSVLRGDTITLRMSNQPNKSFAGIVEMIECEKAILQFNRSFDKTFVGGMGYDVRFSYSRTGLRLGHQALSSISKRSSLLKRLLFPSPVNQNQSNLQRPLNTSAKIRFVNRTLNVEQQAAVYGVLGAVARPSPYLIFGPPGTGKTVTLVEAIIQTAKADPSSRILVCAPSNTATDLIVQRLAPYFGKGEMLRLLAFTRDPKTVPAEVMKFSNFSESENAFVSPPSNVVKKSRIVAVTVASGGKLPNEAINDHFTHVFLDEAGHAIEPMALSCVAEVAKASGGDLPVLVLAGDPKQLGPIIRSQVTKDFGLDKSLLERICECSPYQRYERDDNSRNGKKDPYDSRVMTKLVNNYRSHPAILKLPNERFYDGDLIPSADEFVINSLTNWEHLPQKGFPLIFHGVRGKDEREGNSPSWFNPEEVQIVKEYVGLLVKGTRSNRVKPEEIAVITPYHKQAQKIRMLLRSHDYGDIKVGSVDEFQGSERRVVIISTVRSTKEYMDFDTRHQLGFLSNPKRFNVAITRAQALLIIIGNPFVLEEDNNWNSFVRHCIDNRGYTGVDYTPSSKKREFDAEIEGAISGIADMSLHSKSDDADDFVMVSSTTAQEGPAWRMEE